jgi:hypothetical protein
MESSGLGRLYELMNKSAAAFITAFREYREPDENMKLNKELKDSKGVIFHLDFVYMAIYTYTHIRFYR